MKLVLTKYGKQKLVSAIGNPNASTIVSSLFSSVRVTNAYTGNMDEVIDSDTPVSISQIEHHVGQPSETSPLSIVYVPVDRFKIVSRGQFTRLYSIGIITDANGYVTAFIIYFVRTPRVLFEIWLKAITSRYYWRVVSVLDETFSLKPSMFDPNTVYETSIRSKGLPPGTAISKYELIDMALKPSGTVEVTVIDDK